MISTILYFLLGMGDDLWDIFGYPKRTKMVTQIGNAANQTRNHHFQKAVESPTREHHLFIDYPRRPSFVGTVLFIHLGDFKDLEIGHDR